MTADEILTDSATAFFTRALLNAADANFVASATDLTSRGLPGMNRLTAKDERTFGRAIHKSAQALKSVQAGDEEISSAQRLCAALLDRVPADVALACLASPSAPLTTLNRYAPQRSQPEPDSRLVARILTDIFAAFGQRQRKHPEFSTYSPVRLLRAPSAA